MSRIDQIIDLFQGLDTDTRIELLLDYARKLPPLPEPYRKQRDAGLNRVVECQTPVFLWVDRLDEGRVRVFADVADEAPTIKGFVAILVSAYDQGPAHELAQAPQDLLQRMGMADVVRMNRAVGLGAMIQRLRRMAARAAAPAHAPDPLATHDHSL